MGVWGHLRGMLRGTEALVGAGGVPVVLSTLKQMVVRGRDDVM